MRVAWPLSKSLTFSLAAVASCSLILMLVCLEAVVAGASSINGGLGLSLGRRALEVTGAKDIDLHDLGINGRGRGGGSAGFSVSIWPRRLEVVATSKSSRVRMRRRSPPPSPIKLSRQKRSTTFGGEERTNFPVGSAPNLRKQTVATNTSTGTATFVH